MFTDVCPAVCTAVCTVCTSNWPHRSIDPLLLAPLTKLQHLDLDNTPPAGWFRGQVGQYNHMHSLAYLYCAYSKTIVWQQVLVLASHTGTLCWACRACIYDLCMHVISFLQPFYNSQQHCCLPTTFIAAAMIPSLLSLPHQPPSSNSRWLPGCCRAAGSAAKATASHILSTAYTTLLPDTHACCANPFPPDHPPSSPKPEVAHGVLPRCWQCWAWHGMSAQPLHELHSFPLLTTPPTP